MRFVALVVFLIAIGGIAFAESTTCTSPTYIVPDGRVVESTFAANTYWFAFHGVAGHAYTLEYGAFHSNNNSIFVSPTIYAPADTPCTGGSSTVSVTTTTYVDPYIGDGGSSRRRSWIAATEGNYFISLASSGADEVSYRVIDTTMYEAAWSTFAGFHTQLAFKNTTSSSISCDLTVNTTNGGSATTVLSFTLVSGGSIFRIIGPGADVNVPANRAGDAVLACAGPPGSVIPNAYMIDANTTVIAPVTFGPRDSQH